MSRVKLAHLTTVDMSLRYLVLPQLEQAVAMGWDTIGISAPGEYVAEVEAVGVRHIPLPTSSCGWSLAGDLKAAVDLWKILRRERVDILHTHNPKPGLYGRVLGRLAGVPIVVNTVHGLYATDDDPLAKRTLVYTLEGIASRFSDAELVQSPEDLRLMNRLRLAPRHRTFLLGNGVDLERFDPARFGEPERAEVRRQLGVAEHQIVVGMVGRLVAEKGYPELVEAAGRLGDRYVVVAIGPDDPDKSDALGPDFAARAAAAGVRLLGMRTDVDRLYAGMDVFVLPSHREGFPRAAMEAAASGLPLVVTDVRGCREVVQQGVNGLLVPVSRPEALAAAIDTLGGDVELRRRMGAQSRRLAVQRFDERQIVDTVFGAYRGVAQRRSYRPVLEAAPAIGATPTRTASDRDVPHLARMHRDAISSGFLPRLGPGFMERLYRALIEWEGGVVRVADGGMGPVGFVAGVTDVGAFYRHFIRRYGVGAAFSAAPRLIRPGVARRAIETLRYDGEHDGVGAELLAMAVAPEARRRGLASVLATEMLSELAGRGEPRVKVVVGADNKAAIAAYTGIGFTPQGTIEVHAGERSEVMTWSAPR